MRWRFWFFMALLLTGLQAAGQTVVTGQVVDASSGQPLASVSVSFVASNLGTRADSLGRFRLSGAGRFTEVTFSYVGYLPAVKTIVPGQINRLQVLLERDVEELA